MQKPRQNAWGFDFGLWRQEAVEWTQEDSGSVHKRILSLYTIVRYSVADRKFYRCYIARHENRNRAQFTMSATSETINIEMNMNINFDIDISIHMNIRINNDMNIDIDVNLNMNL